MALLLRVGVGLVVGGGGALLVSAHAGCKLITCTSLQRRALQLPGADQAPGAASWVQASRVLDALQQARARVQAGRTPCGNPLPREVHAVLPPSETANRRIIIVGDIHGCAGG